MGAVKALVLRRLFFALVLFVTVTEACFLLRHINCNSGPSCPIPGYTDFVWNYRVDDITVFKQHSSSPCVEKKHFFIKRGVITMEGGCQALFKVISCARSRIINCTETEGTDDSYKECRINGAFVVHYIEIRTVLSNELECDFGNYGVTNASIWVRKGCRATFFVCYA